MSAGSGSHDSVDAIHLSSGEQIHRLDFTDCILDGPVFRDSLKQKYHLYRDTNNHFKTIVKNAQHLKEQQRKTTAAYQTLLQSIKQHPVSAGDQETHDEHTAFVSIQEFTEMISKQEEKMQKMQESGLDALMAGLAAFQQQYTDQFKEDYKKFEKATEKYCHSQEKYLSVSTKKKGDKGDHREATPPSHSIASSSSFDEMDKTMSADTTMFQQVSTDFVWTVLEMEETTRLNFIQVVYDFTRTYLASFIWAYLENVKRFQNYYPFLEDVINSSQKQLVLTAVEARRLRDKILREPQLAIERRRQFFDRQGYLWAVERKKTLTSGHNVTSTKYFCQYRVEGRQLVMIQYNQVNPPKNWQSEVYRVVQCARKATSESERQFLFDLTLVSSTPQPHAQSQGGQGGPVQIQLTLQAQSSEDRAQWLSVMDGQEPIYDDWRKFQSISIYTLDREGQEFIKFIIHEVEKRGGLDSEGAYRKPGGAKKVTELLEAYFICKDLGPILEDQAGVEVKTLTSSLKRFLKELREPLIPYPSYYKLINVVKTQDRGQMGGYSPESEVEEIGRIISQLPTPNFRALKTLVEHFNRVIKASEVTKMDAGNLATCIGTTLLHSEGESIANVMEIKFVNSIIQMIFNHSQAIFEAVPDGVSVDGAKKSTSLDSLSELAGPGEGRLQRADGTGTGAVRASLNSKTATSVARPRSLVTSAQNSVASSATLRSMKNSNSASHLSPAGSSSDGQTTPSFSRPQLYSKDAVTRAENIINACPFGPKNTCVRALFDCVGELREDELTFHANQVITNVTVSEDPGWLRGTLDGCTGLIPANFVQVIDPMDALKLAPTVM